MDQDAPHAPAGISSRHIESMLQRILTALARTLIRHSVGFPTFVEIAKNAFVDVATRENGLRSRPASKARVALLTGINRREVARVQSRSRETLSGDIFNPVFQVVSRWIREPDFRCDDGKPRDIPLNGASPSLQALTRLSCPDVPMTAVLRELIATGVAEYASPDASRLRLLLSAWVPRHDVGAKLELMGVDVAALLGTIDGNVHHPDGAMFQRKVSFSDLTEEGIAWLNSQAQQDGQAWLESLDSELSRFRSQPGQQGQFGGLGIYVFAERRPSTGKLQDAQKNLAGVKK